MTTPIPQRCVLVLPSTGQFDSRTYRIASSLATRGHTVTVIARCAPGLSAEEHHPAGYRIVRVPVSPVDGLPRPLRGLMRRFAQRPDGPAPTPSPGSIVAPVGRPASGVVGRFRRGIDAAVRLGANGLTIRSQRIATCRVAPPTDLVHAMAYMGIPVGLALGRRDRAPIVYDARDIYVDATNLARVPRPARALLGRVERGWARQADRVMTVNRPYAEVMTARWDVPLPAIVLNCAYRQRANGPVPRRFHERLGLAPSVRVVLYHGGWSAHRGIEQLLEAIVMMNDAVLVLLGYGVLAGELEAAAARPDLAGRVHLLPAVPPEELLKWVAAADVVAMPIQPSTLNHRLTTPNKLFEAMAAGVPVVASDLPGMAPIVRATGCGVVCDPTDPAALAVAIRSLLDMPEAERAAIRARALTAAHDTYNWESQMALLLAEYGRLTGRSW